MHAEKTSLGQDLADDGDDHGRKQASSPAVTAPDRSASSTLIATFPQRVVTSRKLLSRHRAKTLRALALSFFASTSSSIRPVEKKARFRPENMPEKKMQNAIPAQRSISLRLALRSC